MGEIRYLLRMNFIILFLFGVPPHGLSLILQGMEGFSGCEQAQMQASVVVHTSSVAVAWA